MDNKLIEQFDKTQNEIEKVQAEIMDKTMVLQKRLASLQEQDKQVREAIKEAMETHNVKKFENDGVTITYIAPTTRKGVDARKLEELHPKIYQKVLKETPVKSNIRIKVK